MNGRHFSLNSPGWERSLMKMNHSIFRKPKSGVSVIPFCDWASMTLFLFLCFGFLQGNALERKHVLFIAVDDLTDTHWDVMVICWRIRHISMLWLHLV